MKKTRTRTRIIILIIALLTMSIAVFPGTAFAEQAASPAFYNDFDNDGVPEKGPYIFYGKTERTYHFLANQYYLFPADAKYGYPSQEEEDLVWGLYDDFWEKYGFELIWTEGLEEDFENGINNLKQTYGEDSQIVKDAIADNAYAMPLFEEYNRKYEIADQARAEDVKKYEKEHPEVIWNKTVVSDLDYTEVIEKDSLVYFIHVPYDYTPEKKYPVLVMCHGEDSSLKREVLVDKDGTLYYKNSPLDLPGDLAAFQNAWYNQVKEPGAGRDKYDCFYISIIDTNEFFRAQSKPGRGSCLSIVNQHNNISETDAIELNASVTGDSSYKATYRYTYDASELSPAYQSQLMCRLIDSLAEKYSIDLNRQYIAGFSLGGILTMDTISHYPNRFAAAIPDCSASADITEENCKELTEMNIWAIAGNGDSTCSKYFSKLFVEAINTARTKYGTGKDNVAQYSFFPGGHSGAYLGSTLRTANSGVSITSSTQILDFMFDSVKSPCFDHDEEITYEWSDDCTECTATVTCQTEGCGYTETETVSTSIKSKTGSCKEKETITYLASFKNSCFEEQTKTVISDNFGAHVPLPQVAENEEIVDTVCNYDMVEYCEFCGAELSRVHLSRNVDDPAPEIDPTEPSEPDEPDEPGESEKQRYERIMKPLFFILLGALILWRAAFFIIKRKK